MVAHLILLILFAGGLALAIWGRSFRNWLVTAYDNPSITRHLHMRCWLLSLRLIGGGLSAISIWLFIMPPW